MKDKGVTFTVLMDPTRAAASAYKITATPTVYIVGRDGKLVGQAIGNKEWTTPRGRALLEALLAP